METKFQTSFIPKVPLNQPNVAPKRPMSFFNFISLIILFLSLVVAGGSYAYLRYLQNSQEAIKSNLEKNIKAFEPTTIENYARLDARMDAVTTLLSKHVAVSNLFDYLSENTLKTVRFTDFKYDLNPEGSISLDMNGQARNYNSVAYQSRVLGQKRELKNLLFSNLNLDAQNDRVLFKLSTSVDPSFTYYSAVLNKPKQDIFGNNLSRATTTDVLPNSINPSASSTPNTGLNNGI